MEKYEQLAAPIIAQIRAEESIAFLDDGNRVFLSRFIAIQMLRTKQQREVIQGLDESLRRLLTEKSEKMGIKWSREPLPIDEVKALSVRRLVHAEALAPHIFSKSWILFGAEKPGSFFSSDNPVVLQNSSSSSSFGPDLGVASPGVEIYLPLSGSVTLALHCPTNLEKIQKIAAMRNDPSRLGLLDRLSEDYELAARTIDAFNAGSIAQIPAPVVNNLNGLQIEFSTRFLFSPTGAFPRVKGILIRDPHLRRGIKLELK